MKHTTQTNTFLSVKPGLLVQSNQSPLKLNLDPVFLSRELLFQGTISQPKHQRNVFMAGTEYFSQTAQPRDHMPVNTIRKSLIRLSTATHNLLTFDTSQILSNNSEKLSRYTPLDFLLHSSYSSSRMQSHTVGRPAQSLTSHQSGVKSSPGSKFTGNFRVSIKCKEITYNTYRI